MRGTDSLECDFSLETFKWPQTEIAGRERWVGKAVMDSKKKVIGICMGMNENISEGSRTFKIGMNETTRGNFPHLGQTLSLPVDFIDIVNFRDNLIELSDTIEIFSRSGGFISLKGDTFPENMIMQKLVFDSSNTFIGIAMGIIDNALVINDELKPGREFKFISVGVEKISSFNEVIHLNVPRAELTNFDSKSNDLKESE